MRPVRIFLDLDDVLNKFTSYALSQVGCGSLQECYDSYPVECGWNIVKAATTLHPERKFTDKTFWDQIGERQWEYVPRSDEFEELIERSQHYVGRDNVFIMTTCTKSPACLAGKYRWILRECPTWLHRQFFMGGPHKHLAALPGSLLIDDYGENVDRWRVMGQRAILMPRPWNQLNWCSPGQVFDELKAEFK